MSEIRATTISDTAGTGPVAFTGQWAAKSSCAYDQTTPTILSSENISSITDSSAGEHTANLTNSFAAADYGVSSGILSTTNGGHHFGQSATTSSYEYQTRNSAFNLGDNAHSSTQTFGDLA